MRSQLIYRHLGTGLEEFHQEFPAAWPPGAAPDRRDEAAGTCPPLPLHQLDERYSTRLMIENIGM